MKFLIINDFNDINNISIKHFSLDKGHFIAKSLAKMDHDVYFLTTLNDYTKYGIKYIFTKNITEEFINEIDYVIIVREPLFVHVISAIPAIKNKISVEKKLRIKPKFIVKSDSPLWFKNKMFIRSMRQIFKLSKNTYDVKPWLRDHVDYICAQNEDFAKLAYSYSLPANMILISNMSVVNENIDYSKLINPCDVNHSYCVNNASTLINGKALWPAYYLQNIDQRESFNVEKYIIVYTGRIKTDGGKILFNMRNIMNILGDQFELHIFPGSFTIPKEINLTTSCSSKNSNHLEILRCAVFSNNKNIIVHYPYEHEDKYRYLGFAHCGIDFSDTRPDKVKPYAGHAKILEYCEAGLPIVCEENINNLFLIANGKNGIILPYMASDEQYAEAIKKIVTMPIDRQYCRDITVRNENWDKRTIELLNQLK